MYVDDFLVFSNDDGEMSKLEKLLMSKFSVKYWGKAKFVLELNIEQTEKK